jgi:hypothetical protein
MKSKPPVEYFMIVTFFLELESRVPAYKEKNAMNEVSLEPE